MKIYIENLGCDKNKSDGETLAAGLQKHGHDLLGSPRHADLVIINTCGFTDEAKEESIESFFHYCRTVKTAIIGCLSKRYGPSLKKQLKEADFTGGLAHSNATLTALLKKYGKSTRKKETVPRLLSGPVHTAPIKITEGCNNRCSYCAIPLIRGTLRQRSVQKLLEEARFLRKRGVKELVVVAQDITAYGGRRGLPGLLRRLCAVPFEWIRLMYCHPAGVTDDLIHTLRDEPAIVGYIDMPIQHVSNRILQKMNRPYQKADLERIIGKLRDTVPGIAVRTTFLVGFPGETEKDFEELLAFTEKSGFDRMGAFAYSREEGTRAARFRGHVPRETIVDRLNRLNALQNEIMHRKDQAQIGKTLKVLIDAKTDEGFTGRTARDAPEVDCRVLIRNRRVRAGNFYNLKIADAQAGTLFA